MELFKSEEIETWFCHLYDCVNTSCPWAPRDCPCTPGDPTPFLYFMPHAVRHPDGSITYERKKDDREHDPR